jgi:hypothetical protein
MEINSSVPASVPTVQIKKSNPMLPFFMGILFTFLLGGGLFVIFNNKLNKVYELPLSMPVASLIPVISPTTDYICPKTEYVDCMPKIGIPKEQVNGSDVNYCSAEFLSWAKENCPNFKGAAY